MPILPTSFAEQATVTDESIYDEFNDTWPDCWERAAATIDWSEPYECVLPNDEAIDRGCSGT
ncbi:hypothetical protein C8039_09250 [Halogeometricum sp. wsp3]|nr:hypothetical protein C8039_09250 [Halogeometricum sp. wsp3]